MRLYKYVPLGAFPRVRVEFANARFSAEVRPRAQRHRSYRVVASPLQLQGDCCVTYCVQTIYSFARARLPLSADSGMAHHSTRFTRLKTLKIIVRQRVRSAKFELRRFKMRDKMAVLEL